MDSNNKRWSAGRLARIGVLAALSAILYLFPEIPVIPPIYKLDFSTMPALLAGFSMGPGAGLIVVLLKDLTGLTHTSSMGVGELADFLMSGAYVLTACLIYARAKSVRGAVIGMALGTVAMGVAGAATNYWLLIPFYANVMNFSTDAIIGMVAATIPPVDSLWKLILLAVVPFNLLKGAVLSLVGGLLFRQLKPLLDGKRRAA